MRKPFLSDGQRFIFMGDSITDCDRRGAAYPMGTGYARLFRDRFVSLYPETKAEFINKGIGGNTVIDLENRWQDDIMALRPDWLSILVGINDLHRFLNDPATGVSPAQFREAYDRILSRTHNGTSCRIVLLEPFYISRDDSGIGHRSRVMDIIGEYTAVVRDMSRQYGTLLIKTHDIFQAHLQHREPDYYCPEPVHPNQAGHAVIATALEETIDAGA